MDLWIRSKSKKTLVKINAISLSSCSEDYVIESDSGYTLGKYSKIRALEVLDEIQELLMGRIHERHTNKFDIYNGINHKVYEMPEE